MNKKQFLLYKKLFGRTNHHQSLNEYILTDDGLFARKAFYTVYIVFYSSSIPDVLKGNNLERKMI